MLRTCFVGALLLAPVPAFADGAGPLDDATGATPSAPAPAAASTAPAPAKVRRAKAPTKRRPRRRARRPNPRRIAAYKKTVAHWREPPPRAEVHWEGGFRDVTIYSVNWNERVTVRPIRADGTIDPEAIAALAHVLRDRRSGESSPPDERLVRLLYRIADHFDAPQVTVISGYRSGRRSRTSYHAKGAAIDFLLPGIPDREVAEFARTLGRCGVGVYPTSGFVHLDVRERSYYWSDVSGPGQRGRVRQIQADAAWVADHRYRPEADVPPRRDRPDGVQVIRASHRTRTASVPAGGDADVDLVAPSEVAGEAPGEVPGEVDDESETDDAATE